MKKGLKIFLLVVFIFLVFVALYIFYSYKQVSKIVDVASDPDFVRTAQNLFSQNCSDAEMFKEKYVEFEISLKSACTNPGLRNLINDRFGQLIAQYNIPKNYSNIDICSEINNENSEYKKYIAEREARCGL